MVARARIPHELRVPAPDRLEHNADEAWRRGPLAALEQLARPDARAVAVCAMVPSLTAVDAGGRPITPGLLYGDGRGRVPGARDRRTVPGGGGRRIPALDRRAGAGCGRVLAGAGGGQPCAGRRGGGRLSDRLHRIAVVRRRRLERGGLRGARRDDKHRCRGWRRPGTAAGQVGSAVLAVGGHRRGVRADGRRRRPRRRCAGAVRHHVDRVGDHSRGPAGAGSVDDPDHDRQESDRRGQQRRRPVPRLGRSGSRAGRPCGGRPATGAGVVALPARRAHPVARPRPARAARRRGPQP